MVVTAVAGAHQGVGNDAMAVFDATHLPPLLTIPGEPMELRYDVHCLPAGVDVDAEPCDVRGTVFVRRGSLGAYRPLPLQVDETASESRYAVVLPTDVTSGPAGFSYYAVLQSDAAHATITLPAGGARSPQHSTPLGKPIEVRLGAHVFGTPRRADARVFSAAWGDDPADVGLEDGRNLPPVGGSSFDVDAERNVHVLDQVHRRIVVRSADGFRATAVPVGIDGTIADIAVDPNGTTYVLEAERAEQRPVLRAFARSGEARGTVEMRERTASEVRIGPNGPIVLQQPSSQWVPVVTHGQSTSAPAQPAVGQPGRTFPGGNEVVVLRRGSEIRVLSVNANGTRWAWRITSATPLAEVQLAQPMGSGLLLVARVYTDSRDEFVALVLGSEGLIRTMSLSSADWAEAAPLSRFRLVGSSLYQLGSTPSGVFIDRYDLDEG